MKKVNYKYKYLCQSLVFFCLITTGSTINNIAMASDVHSEAMIKYANDVQSKSYPAFGDHSGYIYTGYVCYEAISQEKSKGGRAALKMAWLNFSAGLRPWGMNLYSTIPHFITSDPILIHHIRVLFSLICSLIVSLVLLRFMSNQVEPASLKTYVMIVILAVSLVPYLPILMSDLISFTFFALGLAYLRIVFVKLDQDSPLARSDYLKLFLSGLMFGISVTMKQNYFVFTGLTLFAFIIVYREILLCRKRLTRTLVLAAYFTCGFAFFLTQCLATYTHSGYFFLFNPTTYEPYSVAASGKNRVWLELIAYNLPSPGAFMSSNDVWLNPISYFLVRLYLGMSKLYLPVYHGYSPVNLTIHYNMVLIYLFFLFFICFSFYCYKKLAKELKALTLSSLFVAVFTAYIQHVENRYYLYPRLVYLLLLTHVLFSFSYSNFILRINKIWRNLQISQSNT